MLDRDLEQRLREHFRAEVDDGGPSRSLLIEVSSIPEGAATSVFTGRRGYLVLVAAALLAALLAATAVGVGSGLIRLPWMPPRTGLPAASVVGCHDDPMGADVWVASVESDDSIAGQPAADGLRLRVYGDGSAYVSPRGAAGPDTAVVRRDLSAHGLGLLLDALRDPRLPGCRWYAAAGGGNIRVAMIDQGGPYGISVSDAPGTHVTSGVEAAAVVALRARLGAVDLGLPASAWVDRGWAPYTPGQWHLQLDVRERPQNAGWPDSIVLSDGTRLRDLGTADPTAHDRGLYAAICGIVDTRTARAAADALERAIGDPWEGTWESQDEDASIYLDAVLPLGNGCPAAGTFLASRWVVTDACSIVAGALAGTVHAYIAPRPDAWIACRHAILEDDRGRPLDDAVARPVVSMDGATLDVTPNESEVFLSPTTVAVGQADALAAAVFDHAGLTRAEIAGHPVYYNGCERGNLDDDCESAVAVSADPAFFVITWDGATQHDLQALAEVFVAQLSR